MRLGSGANHCAIPGCTQAAITLPGGGAAVVKQTITYTYDPLNRLTAADYDTGEYFHYTYDSVGNRLSEAKKTTPAGAAQFTAYTYDAANRMTSVSGVAYTWDDNGNLLSDGTYTYTYNHANRLVAVNGPSSIVSFTYNGLGDQLSETINGATTYFMLDINNNLTQVLADGTFTYLYGVGRIAQVSATDCAYFLGDALGSVRQLTNGQGTIILARAYEPYGIIIDSVGNGSTLYGYTGEMQTDGLIFLRTRFYNTASGQFITHDTKEGEDKNPAFFNPFLYGNANPIIFTDPTGMYPAYCDQMPPDYAKDDPNCPGYDPSSHPPYTNDYNEEEKPINISFNQSPPDMKAPYLWQNCDKKTGICTGFVEPGHPGWQYAVAFPGENGLCGQFALAAVLNAMFPEGMDVNELVEMWKTYETGTISYTEPNQLAYFINIKYGNRAHAWTGGTGWLQAINWNGESAVMESLLNGWFAQGTYVVAMINIDPNQRTSKNPIDPQHHAGHLNGGVSENHGLTCTMYNWWKGEDYEPACKGAAHWVVITGVSDQWNNDDEDWSPWKWVRIFNPFQGQTEYYWWADFELSWSRNSGYMVRIDPANAKDTCMIKSSGYCTRP